MSPEILKRDGYTKNLFDGSRIDGRDQYSIRGSIRWQPSDTTTVDLMGYYFHERDDRLRSIKQLCQRDTNFGIMGCTPGGRGNEYPNGNANFCYASSRQSQSFNGIPGVLPTLRNYGFSRVRIQTPVPYLQPAPDRCGFILIRNISRMNNNIRHAWSRNLAP
ncbi:MAG: hypothetical protein IPI83_13380 [Sphingomonadales bacterium]|nr:hypothetical protein [Sphingomonadales bacterium]